MKDMKEKIRLMIERAGFSVSEIEAISEKNIRDMEKQSEKKTLSEIVDRVFGIEFRGLEKLSDLNMPEKIQEPIKNWFLDPEKIFLLLRGGTGTAKTAVAKIFFQHYIFSRHEKYGYGSAISGAKYIRALEFFDVLKRENSEPGGAGDFIRFHTRFNFLIFDEIAASYGTEFERIYFNQLIDDFYTGKSGRKKMILISNAPDHAGLEKYLGKPALSRIDHRGVIVNMVGQDWRKKNKQEEWR